MSEPIALAAAAKLLEINRANAARWLRRYLSRREQATGQKLLVDLNAGTGRRPVYRVSLERVRAFCPELVGHDVGLARVVQREARASRAALRELEEKVDDLRIDLVNLRRALDAPQAGRD